MTKIECDCSLKHTNKGVCNCPENLTILDEVNWQEEYDEELEAEEDLGLDSFHNKKRRPFNYDDFVH